MLLVFGFLCLGLLIGNLVGMTSESVVSHLVTLLFALLGGSILVFLHRLPHADRRLAGALISALSLGALLGVYGGVLTVQYQILSPHHKADIAPASSDAHGPTESNAAKKNSPPGLDIPHPPAATAPAIKAQSPCDHPSPYLRKATTDAVSAIDAKLDAGLISEHEAYMQMRALIGEVMK